MSLKIGFLGGGKMAQALANGFISKGLTKGGNLIASAAPQDKQCFAAFKAVKELFSCEMRSAKTGAKLIKVQDLGGSATTDNVEVVKNSSVVFLSVKPDIATTVLKEVSEVAKPDHLFISICMGIPLKTLQKALPPNAKVIRAMPNTPALVGSGASVFALGKNVTQDDSKVAQKLLSSVGIAEQVPEKWIDPVTGLSGSGPAYILLTIESLADGGVQQGLPRDLALRLAAQTVLGTGKMAIESHEHPAKLRDNVTSPGGSTAAGLAHLEKNAVRSAFQGAVESAVKRCNEMAASHESPK